MDNPFEMPPSRRGDFTYSVATNARYPDKARIIEAGNNRLTLKALKDE